MNKDKADALNQVLATNEMKSIGAVALSELLPRCEKLDGSTLRIVSTYTEAGYFCEANCVTIEDKEGRRALYAPVKVLESVAPRAFCRVHKMYVNDELECTACVAAQNAADEIWRR